jgi:hypothetical protein
MKAQEKYSRITITLPPDLAQWVKSKEADLNAKDRRMRTSVSAIIADAVEEMKKREETNAPGQAMPDRIYLNEDFVAAQPHSGPVITNPRKTSAGGSKIQPTRYPTKRQAKS